jgi:hypothetical protein
MFFHNQWIPELWIVVQEMRESGKAIELTIDWE